MGEEYKLLKREGNLVKIENGESTIIGPAIKVSCYFINIDTEERFVKFKFKDGNKLVSHILRRDKITKSGVKELTRYGAPCWDDTAESYVEYFRRKINKIKPQIRYSNIGWGSYQNKEFFRLYNAIGIEGTYNELKYDLKPKGTLKAWLSMVKKEVIPNKFLALILCIGFAAPLVKVIGEKEHMETIICNICGLSSTGKTTASKLAVSPFGLPSDDTSGLIKSWYSTDQSMLTDLGGNFGVPIVIDDTSTAESGKDFTQVIYQLAAGKEKNALNSDGTKRPQNEWDTVILTSSEKSIFDQTDNKQGIRVRLMEIKEAQITTSAENAEAIEKVILQNYGYPGIEYIRHIVKIGKKKIYKRWKKVRNDIISRKKGDRLFKRASVKLALIRLAGELANESLNLGLDINKLTDTLISLETKAMKSRNEGERAYRYVLNYFESNQGKFFKDKEDVNYREVVGKYIQERGKIKEIRMPTEQFKNLMEKGKFNIEQVVSKWKKKDLLIHDDKKNTIARVFKPGMPKTAQYAIKVSEVIKKKDTSADVDEEIQNKIARDRQEYRERKHKENGYYEDVFQNYQKEGSTGCVDDQAGDFDEIEKPKPKKGNNKVRKISIRKGKKQDHKGPDEKLVLEEA